MIYFEADYVGETYDLEHPRILWNSVTRRGTVAASSEATGFEAVNAATATEFDEWSPAAMPANWTLTFDTTETVNAIGIQQHTIGSSGATVIVQEWNGSAWVDVVQAAPDDDEPIAFLFRARSTDRIRLSFTGSASPKIGVLVCCEAIEIPQRVYMGAATPIDMALETSFATNMSTGGRYMGRSILYAKNENGFSVQHLTEAYVRRTLMAFIKDARTHPYFLLERPYTRPTALSYRWRDDDIRPERMGILSLMQVSL